MVTGDGAYIRKINRTIIIKEIIHNGRISRADLSKITGLNKATISVQVSNLLEEGLIYETQPEHNVIGRRPIMLSINEAAGYVLGIDLDYKEIHYTLADLSGKPIQTKTIDLETDDYNKIVQKLINDIKEFKQLSENTHYGLINVTIGIHGTVNKNETIFFIPRYQWHNKNLKADLIKEIDIPIHIENNANLSSYAEKVYKHQDSHNLLTIILSSGIGTGILVDGILHKGYHGYAGEMGHMIVMPNGHPCKCGNQGCWEQYASEPKLFKQLEKQLGETSMTYDDLQKLLRDEHRMVLEQLDEFITFVAIGLNNVINIYNPETIVLNSKVLEMYPNAIEQIKQKLTSSVSQYREIVLSDLGYSSTVMGACAFSIQTFFEVSDLILTLDKPHS
ncbi:ROK family transcriptional regulator [Desertibacillus haloalkaliphilus]|uniref:ROK family transcriptional regulator n=1 Tax=Desertibacillus haloalkaliphilus TaxID=1328930 RepID=UPI001C267377|nr:ROK family transcriptional regulator [Desertibacillus haloalkaliphilus]MBU8906335.1 ROK family transcriptional regulator [Desertibacillus haloalkaliphilus]